MPRSVKQALISSAILLFLFVAGGFGYLWYSGNSEPLIQNTAQQVATENVSPLKPTAVAKDAKESASVQFITLPAAPGENAMITVKTLPGSTCSIGVVYNNVPARDSGLVNHIANEYGVVSWTWSLPASIPLGSWPVTVTCTYQGKSAVVVADLVVAKSGTAPAPTQ